MIINIKKNKNQSKNTKDGIKAEDFLRRKKQFLSTKQKKDFVIKEPVK